MRLTVEHHAQVAGADDGLDVALQCLRVAGVSIGEGQLYRALLAFEDQHEAVVAALSREQLVDLLNALIIVLLVAGAVQRDVERGGGRWRLSVQELGSRGFP